MWLLWMALAGCGTTHTTETSRCTVEDEGLGNLDRDGDGELTALDLDPGEAALHAVWTTAEGETRTGRYTSTTTRVVHGDIDGNLDRWAVWFRVDCEPEQAAFVWFRGPSVPPLVDGQWEAYTASWDAPPVEQGGEDLDAAGTVDIEVGTDTVSGRVTDTSTDIPIVDYLEVAPTGERVELRAMAFRDIEAEID